MSAVSPSAEPTDEELKRRAALLRSMTLTRMLDYGMDFWDATQLVSAPASQPWDDAATTLADAQVETAEAAAARGDVETAVASYRRATAALVFAQMAHNRDNAAKRMLYARLTATYQRAADLDASLAVTRLLVSYGTGYCAAWLVQPPIGQPSPTVVVVGGQSGWGAAYHRQAEALAARGLTTVLLEAPGQGETRLVGGITLDRDADRAFSATLDAVQETTGYAGPFGVWGNSFGGLLAARATLADPRFVACCVNGAPARPEPSPFRTASEQSQALLGVTTDDEVAAVFRTLWVNPNTDRTGAAVLVLHGGRDPLIDLDQQQPFLELSDRSELRVWQDGEHTIYNHSAERTEHVADWFRKNLRADGSNTGCHSSAH